MELNIGAFITEFNNVQTDGGDGFQLGLEPTGGRQIVQLFGDRSRKMAMRLRTGEWAPVAGTDPVRFDHIEFYGSGTVSVRVYVDREYVCDDESVDITSVPGGLRKVNLPKGTKGYTIDIEMAGVFEPRSVKLIVSEV